MKTLISALLLLCVSHLITLSPSYASPPSVAGKWKSFDDKTNKPRSIIEISQDSEGKLIGHIRELIDPKEENPICDKCSGENKNQPIIGLQILWGLTEHKPNKEWRNGQILDPESGRVYNARITFDKESNELHVRGFVGFSLIGRTQTWKRE